MKKRYYVFEIYVTLQILTLLLRLGPYCTVNYINKLIE